MKKLYTFIALAIFSSNIFAGVTCTVDTSNHTLGISPPDSTLPCIMQGQLLSDSFVAQVFIPDTFNATIGGIPISAVIYWIDITSITGFPNGLSYVKNPMNDTVLGNEQQCILLTGTTNDPVGNYPLTFDGFIKVNLALLGGDTVLSISLLNALAQQGGVSPFSYNLRVCNPNGINELNKNLNNAISVAPNPNNGNFELHLSAGKYSNSEISVFDVTGRKVYSEQLDVAGEYHTNINLGNIPGGLYTVHLRTPEGMATKNISVE